MANDSAKAIIRQALDQYGLGSLADWAWDAYLKSGASDISTAMTIIQPELRNQPAYKARFPAMEKLAQKGHAISEANYVSYEQTVTQTMRAAGLPEGFYDSPDDFARFLENEISPAEIQERVGNAQAAIYNASPAVRQQITALYGVGATPGDVTAFFLDPDKAEPLLNRQLAAAKISGKGVDSGYGALSRDEAERVGAAGITDEAINQGFSTLVKSADTFDPQIGRRELGSGGISRDDQLGAAFLGDADAQEAITAEQRKRKASFSGGGQFGTDKTGVAGLGSAAS